MNINIEKFIRDNFKDVRSTVIDGKTWYVARDIAAALGYKNTNQAINKHVDSNDKRLEKIDTAGGKQNINVINESGVYILMQNSYLPLAQDLFKQLDPNSAIETVDFLNIIENTELVGTYNGSVMTSSLRIAEVFNKKHSHVLEKIRDKKGVFPISKLQLVNYTDEKGELRPMYLLDRDATSFIIMSFTGSKADQWKLKYIDAFNKMEEMLKQSNVLSEEEKLKLQLFSKDPLEVAAAHTKLLDLATAPLKNEIVIKDQVLTKQKPLVEFATQVSKTDDLIDMNAMAKLLKDENINIGRTGLFDWLRKNCYLMKNNLPYQQYIRNGIFKVKESTYLTPAGKVKTRLTTHVTGKGQIYLINKVKENYV